MTTRYYANAPATDLSASCSDTALTISVTSTTGFPIQYPYTLILDRGTATEEAVSVTAASGTTLTVTRAIDGTTAFAHAVGATVEHGITAQDVREPNAHINTGTAVHGLSGDVVGTVDSQILTHKDLTDATNTFPTTLATDTEVATAQTNAEAYSDAALATHEADTSTHGVGVIVGETEAQPLTNKTIALGSNTVSGTKAQFNAALTDDDFATQGGAETLSNKTLASPTLTGAPSWANLDAGTVSQALTGGTVTSVAVTFANPFSAAPIVTCGLASAISSGLSAFCWASAITATGFTLNMLSSNSTTRVFSWTAVKP